MAAAIAANAAPLNERDAALADIGAAIARAIGQDIASHPLIDALKGAETRVTRLPADVAVVAAFVAGNV